MRIFFLIFKQFLAIRRKKKILVMRSNYGEKFNVEFDCKFFHIISSHDQKKFFFEKIFFFSNCRSFLIILNLIIRYVGDEAWLATTVATQGPVSVCFYANSGFQNYKSGNFLSLIFKLMSRKNNLFLSCLTKKVFLAVLLAQLLMSS